MATVDIVISGLADNTAPSLATFDVDVSFDTAVLDFSGAAFGSQLDLFGLGDVNSLTAGVGTVNLFELSLESATDLDNLQTDTFVLATLSFSVLSGGTSPLGIAVNALGDSLGDALSADIITGSITGVSAVPEPATWALWVLGLLVTMTRYRARTFGSM